MKMKKSGKGMKSGKMEMCSCGSGKKHEDCCGCEC